MTKGQCPLSQVHFHRNVKVDTKKMWKWICSLSHESPLSQIGECEYSDMFTSIMMNFLLEQIFADHHPLWELFFILTRRDRPSDTQRDRLEELFHIVRKNQSSWNFQRSTNVTRARVWKNNFLKIFIPNLENLPFPESEVSASFIENSGLWTINWV